MELIKYEHFWILLPNTFIFICPYEMQHYNIIHIRKNELKFNLFFIHFHPHKHMIGTSLGNILSTLYPKKLEIFDI